MHHKHVVKIWGRLAKVGSTYISNNMYIYIYMYINTCYISGTCTPWHNPHGGASKNRCNGIPTCVAWDGHQGPRTEQNTVTTRVLRTGNVASSSRHVNMGGGNVGRGEACVHPVETASCMWSCGGTQATCASCYATDSPLPYIVAIESWNCCVQTADAAISQTGLDQCMAKPPSGHCHCAGDINSVEAWWAAGAQYTAGGHR
jgi:hypothetical protein